MRKYFTTLKEEIKTIYESFSLLKTIKKLMNVRNRDYVDLALTDDADKDGAYIDALDWAISNKILPI